MAGKIFIYYLDEWVNSNFVMRSWWFHSFTCVSFLTFIRWKFAKFPVWKIRICCLTILRMKWKSNFSENFWNHHFISNAIDMIVWKKIEKKYYFNVYFSFYIGFEKCQIFIHKKNIVILQVEVNIFQSAQNCKYY